MKKGAIVAVLVIIVLIGIRFSIVKFSEISRGKALMAARTPDVVLAEVSDAEISKTVEIAGRIESTDKVELVARIDGYLQKKHFAEGDYVKKGQVLFTIEQTQYLNALNKAKADLESAKAALYKAERDYQRGAELVKKDFISKAVILIQRVFRGYLLKIKLYNNINLYICCKRGVYILEHLFLSKKKKEYYKFKKIIYSHKIRNSMNSPFSMKEKSKSNSCLKLFNNKKKKVERNNENNRIIKSINIFRKELRDSFNIINRNIKREENNEKKLKSKLNDVIKENNQLKNKLIDNKNIKEKIKNLIDENIKNHNINTIIMRDNKQLAKKLKDFQEYRNNNLIIEIQPSSFYLIKDENNNEKIKYQELKLSQEFFKNKLKKLMLEKLIKKRMNHKDYIMKEKIYKLKNVSKRLNELSQKRILHLTKIFNIIEKYILLKVNKSFWILFNFSKKIQNYEQKIKEINEIKMILKKEQLKKMVRIIEQKKRNLLYTYFYKIVTKNIIFNINKIKENKEFKKLERIKKIFIKYEKNIKLIYKVFLEKWNLTAKIIGMRAAARDKKKKRKLKKKNNKLLYNKNFIITDNYNKYNNGQKLCKSSNEFSIFSKGKITKDFKDSIKKNGFIKENKKKTKSLNKILISQNTDIINEKINRKSNSNLYNINNKNEESNEDSGDTFEFENNSN